MGRWGGMLASGCIWLVASGCIWLVLCVPQAGAARSADLPPAQAAKALARIIRRDAGQQYRRSKTAVTVTLRCCGVRVLRVHYSSATVRAGAGHDGYVLTLETARGILQGVAISESATEAGYAPHAGHWTANWQEEFAIQHTSRGPSRGWRFTDSHGDISSVEEVIDGHTTRQGVGGSRECRAPQDASLPIALYREALLLLESAKRHVPLMRSPFTNC